MFDEIFVRRVADDYPAPIADRFVKLAALLNNLRPSLWEAFARLIDCFEVTVQYTALVATAAYLQNETRSPAANRAILELRDNPKLATGHWWALLRETLRLGSETPLSVLGQLSCFYYANGKPTETARRLNLIPEVRNSIKAHGWTKPEAEYEKLLHSHGRDLQMLLESASMLCDYRLLDVLECRPVEEVAATPNSALEGSGTAYVAVTDWLCGSRRIYPRLRLSVSEPLVPGHLYVFPASNTEQITSATLSDEPLLDEMLSVHPFVVRLREGPFRDETALFAGYEKGKPTFVSCLSSERVMLMEHGPAFIDRVEGASGSGRKGVALNPRAQAFVAPLAARAHALTREYLDRLRGESVYQPRFYTERKSLRALLDDFLEDDKPALLLSGPSGIGKSNAICAFADEAMSIADPCFVPLLLHAADIRTTGDSLEKSVRLALGLDVPLTQWLSELKSRLKRSDQFTLFVLLDGMDKHPSVASLMRSINEWASQFRHEPSLRLLATCTPAGLQSAASEGESPNPEAFFAPVRGILAAGTATPVISMEEFNETDLAEAYERYREHGGFQPTTPFADLPVSARRALSHPLFLRLAMEVFNGEEMPPRPISHKILARYCKRYVFTSRTATDFVDTFVDALLERKARELSDAELCAHPNLRAAYIDPHGPFETLLQEPQILSVRPRALHEELSLPHENLIEFTTDRVFQYLLLHRAVRRFGLTPRGLAEMAAYARDYPHLRVGIVGLLADLARHGRWELVLSVSQHDQSAASSDETDDSLFHDVLVELSVEDAPLDGADSAAPEAAEQDGVESAFHEAARPSTSVDTFLSALLDRDANQGTRVALHAVDLLFNQGRWPIAMALMRRVTEREQVSALQRFDVNNRLVVMCKNMDYWDEAQGYSDVNEGLMTQELNGQLSPEQLAQHRLNRSSVLYDRGERPAALLLCRAALEGTGDGGAMIQCAAANNLGIMHAYFDQPTEAERVLSAALPESEFSPILRGHLLLNRALVRLFALQVAAPAASASSALSDAENDLQGADDAFETVEYAQGILYARGSSGLIAMQKGDWDAAKKHLLEAVRGAEQLGEEWPRYGALANLALWHRHPDNPLRDLSQAHRDAQECYEAAGDNNDVEGTAIAALVLARVLLDTRDETSEVGELNCDAVESMLLEAEESFVALGFYSAAAQACAGLEELFVEDEPQASEWHTRKLAHRGRLEGLYRVDFADTFEPFDWKYFFMAELL